MSEETRAATPADCTDHEADPKPTRRRQLSLTLPVRVHQQLATLAEWYGTSKGAVLTMALDELYGRASSSRLAHWPVVADRLGEAAAAVGRLQRRDAESKELARLRALVETLQLQMRYDLQYDAIEKRRSDAALAELLALETSDDLLAKLATLEQLRELQT